MKSIRVLGTGSYVPPRVLTNFDLQDLGLKTTDEWITSRTGGAMKPHRKPGVERRGRADA
jgi:3-oxoacyl-[acyl-carrier-protein] synthase-3